MQKHAFDNELLTKLRTLQHTLFSNKYYFCMNSGSVYLLITKYISK